MNTPNAPMSVGWSLDRHIKGKSSPRITENQGGRKSEGALWWNVVSRGDRNAGTGWVDWPSSAIRLERLPDRSWATPRTAASSDIPPQSPPAKCRPIGSAECVAVQAKAVLTWLVPRETEESDGLAAYREYSGETAQSGWLERSASASMGSVPTQQHTLPILGRGNGPSQTMGNGQNIAGAADPATRGLYGYVARRSR